MNTPEDSLEETRVMMRCDRCKGIVMIQDGKIPAKCPLCWGKLERHSIVKNNKMQCEDKSE